MISNAALFYLLVALHVCLCWCAQETQKIPMLTRPDPNPLSLFMLVVMYFASE